ncbi:ABC transporter ATP-binding protein [Treponema sp. R80B11-R83G3]
MPRLLEVNNLAAGIKKDGKIFQILKDVSFSIDEGEIVGLAGESGCGKSMTALSIPNLLPQPVKILGGEIILNHIPLTSLGEKELCYIRGKEISVIFQDIRQSLNPLMMIGGQITEMLELAGSTDKEANKSQALETLASLGFDEPEKIFDAFPHQLSGGMCQRVMTAIAVIRRPRLLLADEPSSALDMESQQRILSLLAEMNRKYKTSVLIISHDLSIIRQFCNRFLVMYAGKIIEEGQSGALFSPLHPYTNALLKAIPEKEKRGKKLNSIHGKVPSIYDSFSGCPFAPRCEKAQSICSQNFPPQKEINGAKVHCYYPSSGEPNA